MNPDDSVRSEKGVELTVENCSAVRMINNAKECADVCTVNH